MSRPMPARVSAYATPSGQPISDAQLAEGIYEERRARAIAAGEPDPDDAETYPEPRPCPACGGGEASMIGMLGWLLWARCRACGCEYSTDTRDE